MTEDHPFRREISDEIHARPIILIGLPSRVRRLVFQQNSPHQVAATFDAFSAYCVAEAIDPPRPYSRQHSFERDGMTISWEFHTEFITVSWVSAIKDEMAMPDNIGLQLLDGFSLVTAARVDVMAEKSIPDALIPGFSPVSFCHARVDDGRAEIATDFRTDADGFVRFELAAGATFTLDRNAFAGLVPGTGRATLAAGPLARFDAPGLLATLDAYPYGCTEQLTSKALPLLYFSDVSTALGVSQKGDVSKRVTESIAEILLNQSSNGAFGLWYPDTGDLWLDAYVTDFLSRARAQGYTVPDSAFRNALDNLRNQINYAPDFDENGGPYAYALMVLAREGAAAIGDLRYYADVKTGAFDTPMAAAQLGAALASYGDQRRADAMFAKAAGLVALHGAGEESRLWRADYGTRLRDATALLALASEAGSTAFDPDDLTNAVAFGMTGQHLSTQEATWALLATHAP